MERQYWHWKAIIGCIVLIGAGAWMAYAVAERNGVRSLHDATMHRLDIYVAGLQSKLSRYDYLPSLVALNEDVSRLLRQPSDPQLHRKVNLYLETAGRQADASAVYVIDARGITLAASNWNTSTSFVGNDYSYRPYFQDAIRRGAGKFYGIGTASHEPGYYFSYGIGEGDKVIGVVVVKVSLDKMDASWTRSAEKILVADGNGVIFLSSEPGWKFKTLERLPDATIEQLTRTRQYTEAGKLEPVGLRKKQQLPDGGIIVQTDAQQDPPQTFGHFLASEYLLQSRPVPGTDWKLVVLSNMQPTHALARNTATVTAFALGFLILSILYLRQRRRIVRQNLAARAALQKAHDELERKVTLRTEALSEANAHLQTEIAERRRAEEILKATLDDLVHTGKLAVLGQMSAGITHELNQPLAALRTLSANAIQFQERGQHEHVESNLRVICQLTDRMGKITAQLKKFARKAAIELQAVAIAPVIDDALVLLDQRLRSGSVQLQLQIASPDLKASCDENRLEQVIVNLLSNALDAMEGRSPRHLKIAAFPRGEWVVIEVHDNGAGIAEDVMPHVFEPFFTTKEQGAGLGLGLAISAGIVRDFGGTLRAGRSEMGGAVFIMQLKAIREEPNE
jgi:two-component system C4-dicarboxylate transport sensor histidine kinase DctB